MSRTVLRLLPLLVVAALLAGCGDNTGGGSSEQSASAPAAKKSELPDKFQEGVKVALVRQLGSGDFFQQWLLGAREQAKALNIDLRVSDARNNNDQQATDLQRAIDQKVDAIIVDHGLASTVNPLIDKAVEAGIPVVAFDVETPNEEVVSIQQSDVDAGKRISEELVKGIDGKGEVGLRLRRRVRPAGPPQPRLEGRQGGQPGHRAGGPVRQGVRLDRQRHAGAGQRRHHRPPGPGRRARALRRVRQGRRQRARAEEQDGVKVYGADVSTADIAVMTKPDSPWVATIATDPANVGRVAVRAAALKLNGDPIDREVLITPSIITQDFLRENDIKTLEQLRDKLPRARHAGHGHRGLDPEGAQ